MTRKSSNNSAPKVAGIILAGGTSSRMGKTKQLLPVGDKTMLAWVVEAALNSALQEIILVLGHAASEIRQALDYPNVSFVNNPEYEKGQGHSIAQGIRQVDDAMDAVILLLGDQPLLKPDTINELVAAYTKNRSPIIIPCFRGRQGNPVLFDRRFFKQLEKLSGDVGGKAVFDAHQEKISRIEVKDPGIHFDVDTDADYTKLQKRIRARQS